VVYKDTSEEKNDWKVFSYGDKDSSAGEHDHFPKSDSFADKLAFW
jgi:hypothetical protein